MNLAARYEQQGNHEGALRLYRQVVQAEPGNRSAQQRIAALGSPQPGGLRDAQQTMVAEAAAPETVSPQAPVIREPAALPPSEVEIDVTENTAAPAPLPEETEVVITPDPAFADSAAATDEPAFEPPEFVVAETVPAPELTAEWWASDAEEDPFESPIEEAAPSVEESPADWSRTSSARLCEGASPDLHAVIGKLDSTDAADRKQALVNLARQGADAQSALPAIEAMLSDPDILVQAHAAWSIWEVSHNPEDSIDPLLVLLVEDNNPEITQISAYFLGAIGPDAAVAEDALWHTCDHTAGITRLHAAEALARITPEDSRPVEILITALGDTELETRWLAAMALSSTGPQHRTDVISALTTALADPSPEVCAAAALSLGGFGDQAAPAESQLNAAASSENEDVRTAARMALDCFVQ
jgi:hypothetical protein